MSYRRQTLEAIGRLLSYPTDTYLEAAELLYVILRPELPEAAECIAAFARQVEPLDVHALEESYARTFDINPACALEVGWHLFGEEYTRGLFLVRLRGEMREYGVEESSELPDHIVHVLALIAAMPDDEAQRLVQACVLPAVDKMQQALDSADNAYRNVVGCLALVLQHEFGRAEAERELKTESGRSRAIPQGDPLRDYPLPCGADGAVEFVPLQMEFCRDATPAPGDVQQAAGGTEQNDPRPTMQRHSARQGGSHG